MKKMSESLSASTSVAGSFAREVDLHPNRFNVLNLESVGKSFSNLQSCNSEWKDLNPEEITIMHECRESTFWNNTVLVQVLWLPQYFLTSEYVDSSHSLENRANKSATILHPEVLAKHY